MTIKEENNKHYIVGIGASAGGLDAIQGLFDNLPENTGMSFVIVQHLSPNYKSLMDELLAKHTRMPITLATDGILLEPNSIYLNPKEKNIICKNGKIFHLDKDNTYPLNLPIDIFFHSLGNEYEHRAIGIILSGTGSDGSRGISTIKESGGTVIVQEPSSAQFDGMPVTAINSQLADYILKPENIGSELQRIANTPNIININQVQQNISSETYLSKVINTLSEYSGIDFTMYKPNTLIRRIEKRININQLDSLEEYFNYLLREKDEQEKLFNECMINVTSFFRDPEAFEVIKEKILPDIFNPKRTQKSIRFWAIGCSTGEEAYSLALMIEEYQLQKKLTFDYKIFATDADSRSIQIAGSGLYPVNLVTDVPKQLLEKYFVKKSGKYEIVKKIRERIVFSVHNILKDPPFIRMDFISCRNLLIYMANKSQRKIVNTFQFSLNYKGYLLLGNSENISDIQNRFDIIDSKWRLYKNISDKRTTPMMHSEGKITSYTLQNPNALDPFAITNKRHLPEHTFNQSIAENFGPSCVYLDNNMNVLFMNGYVVDYLKFSRGMLKQNLQDMVLNEQLAAILRNGLRRLHEEGKTVVFNKFAYHENEKTELLNISFRKLEMEQYPSGVSVILFEKPELAEEDKIVYDPAKIDDFTKQRISDLEKELKAAREETQNVVEELETSNEELQASNEELQASNEELQSTNEELQSVNEELYTINSELQAKNRELFELNNDMTNLLSNTNIALLFLTKDLRIRVFTPELKRIFNLQDSDVNRPINSFASNFINISGKELAADVKNVIEKDQPLSKELISEDNHYYYKKILPYKTSEGKIEGAVITFLNVTDIKRKDDEYKRTALRLQEAMELGKMAWWEWEYTTGRFIYSAALVEMLGYKPATIGEKWEDYSKLIHPEDYEPALQTMRDHIDKLSNHYEINYRIRRKDGTFAWYHDRGEIVKRDSNGKPLKISGVVVDISSNRRREEELNKFYKAFLQSPTPTLISDGEGTIEFVNHQLCQITGYTSAELIGKNTNIFKSGKHTKKFYNELWHAITSKKVWEGEIANKKKDGTLYWERATISPIFNGNGRITNFIKVAQDISTIVESREQLKNDKIRAEESDRLKSAFLANMSHEIRTPMNAIVGFGQLLEDPDLSDTDRKDFIRTINSQGEYLLSLINDIIDISKVEAGVIDLRDEICQVPTLLDDLLKFYLMNKTNNIEIINDSPEVEFASEIYTDATRLRQILNNLIGNAVKFTEKGEVHFGVKKNKVNELLFYVSDTGIGIPKDQLENVFDRFYQVTTSSHENKRKGTGLGLAITKALVNLLGGKLWVESEELVGSTFYFTMPYKPVKHDSLIKPVTPEHHKNIFKNHTILIVEDIESNYQFLKHALDPTGATIHWAKNGKEAIEEIKNDGISVVLMDISMPVLDGYVATRKIRQINKKIPIIAQTAYAMEGDNKKALEAGCNEYITKPIRIDYLISIINKQLTLKKTEKIH